MHFHAEMRQCGWSDDPVNVSYEITRREVARVGISWLQILSIELLAVEIHF